MKKGIVVGVIVVGMIIAIIGISSLESSDNSLKNDTIDSSTESQEVVPQTTGRNLSVELSESMDMKGP